LAVVAGMKKPNDHAQPTTLENKSVLSRVHYNLYVVLYINTA